MLAWAGRVGDPWLDCVWCVILFFRATSANSQSQQPSTSKKKQTQKKKKKKTSELEAGKSHLRSGLTEQGPKITDQLHLTLRCLDHATRYTLLLCLGHQRMRAKLQNLATSKTSCSHSTRLSMVTEYQADGDSDGDSEWQHYTPPVQ